MSGFPSPPLLLWEGIDARLIFLHPCIPDDAAPVLAEREIVGIPGRFGRFDVWILEKSDAEDIVSSLRAESSNRSLARSVARIMVFFVFDILVYSIDCFSDFSGCTTSICSKCLDKI